MQGYVRDTLELNQLNVPVWSVGTSVLSAKQRLRVSHVGEPLQDFNHPLLTTCNESVTIKTGDYIVSDSDGVIVLSPESMDLKCFLSEIRERALQIRNIDDKIKAAIESEPQLTIAEAFQRYR